MKTLVTVFDRVMSAIEDRLVLIFVGLALVLGVTQVVLRYAFNTGITWAEVIFVFFTVAGMMFAGSRAVRDDKHVGVDLIAHLAPAPVRRALSLIALIVSFGLTAYYAYCGFRYSGFVKSIDSISPATGIPDWLFYGLVPITMGAFALRYIERIILALRGEDRNAGGHGASDPNATSQP